MLFDCHYEPIFHGSLVFYRFTSYIAVNHVCPWPIISILNLPRLKSGS